MEIQFHDLKKAVRHLIILYMNEDRVRPGFSSTVPVLWILKSSAPVSCQIWFRTENVPSFS
jgi:hypothetical protein